jgi:ribosomal protein S18 acetylase RimI-like enzyme
MLDYIIVSNENEYRIAANLFQEYAEWLGIDLGFQKFEDELLSLQTMYGPPHGTIILCKDNHEFMACVAVRPIDDKIAELKRMYVKPDFQRKGIGEELLRLSLAFAKNAGYEKARLDTLNTMLPAMNLYTKNGFKEIPAYYYNPEPTAVYFEKSL